MLIMNRFLNRYLPYYGPEDGSGAGGVDDTGAAGADTGAAGADGGAADDAGDTDGRSPIRQQLDKTIDDLRKDGEAEARDKKTGRYQSAARREGIAGGGEAGADGAGDGAAAAAAVAEMPKAFGGDLAQSWNTVPPAWQQAIAKREADMQRGVDELRGRYSDIDRALEPHMQEIRRHGKSPGEAVNQLFMWMQALGSNPQVAFPALAKSFNFDLASIGVGQQTDQQGQQPSGQQPAGDVPPAVQQYITKLEQRLNEFEQNTTQRYESLAGSMQREMQGKTEEVLAQWAKGKEHFEAVRGDMAHLIQSGIVPLKDGKVDLDGAYERAIWANPEIRTKVLTAQEQAKAKAAADKAAAEKAAQQGAADRARKAGVSLTGGAPGAPGVQQQGKRGQRKSVRESLNEAIEQVRG